MPRRPSGVMIKSVVRDRALLASFILGGFAIFVFSAAKVPQLFVPPFGGLAHPWIATALMAATLAGAVFFQPLARVLAWGCVLAFGVFELCFMTPLLGLTFALPTAGARWDSATRMASGAALLFLLFALPVLYEEHRASRRAS